MRRWFTSDTHFGHKNVIRYCGRPFCHQPEYHSRLLRGEQCPYCDLHWMHKTLTDNWNARVAPEDFVYHLGDFAFGAQDKIAQYRAGLNGHIILVQGNHDKSEKVMAKLGFEVYRSLELPKMDGPSLYLTHKPQWEKLRNGEHAKYDYMLNGHVHEHWARVGKLINVGVDRHGFQPISLSEALATTDERTAPTGQDESL